MAEKAVQNFVSLIIRRMQIDPDDYNINGTVKFRKMIEGQEQQETLYGEWLSKGTCDRGNTEQLSVGPVFTSCLRKEPAGHL